MKNNLLKLSALVMIFTYQTSMAQNKFVPCSTDEIYSEQLNADPLLLNEVERSEKLFKLHTQSMNKTEDTLY